MVWERVPKREKKTGRPLPVYMYECVFEIPPAMRDKFLELIEWKDRYFVRIGRSYATAEKCERGDIITILPIRIREYIDEKTGKSIITWMFPKFKEKKPEKERPDTWDTVKKIMALGTAPPETLSDVIKLPLCPFFNIQDLCPFTGKFFIPRQTEMKKIQYLKYPIKCYLAYIYRCPCVKPYYYGIKEVED